MAVTLLTSNANVFLLGKQLDDAKAEHVNAVTAAVETASVWAQGKLFGIAGVLAAFPATPYEAELLCRWKATEESIGILYGFTRIGGKENPDVAYWKDKAEAWLKQILTGEVIVGGAAGVGLGPKLMTSNKDADVDGKPYYPQLGYGEFGEGVWDENGNEYRENYGNEPSP